MNIRERFYKRTKVVDNCLETTYHLVSGYGQVWYNRKNWKANKLAWYIAHGEIPDGLCVLHTCDNRACVKLSHLYLGTNADNSTDMVLRDRAYHPMGNLNKMAKLNDDIVRDIRKDDALGMLGIDIAAKYGVSKQTICGILKGRTWKHVQRQESQQL